MEACPAARPAAGNAHSASSAGGAAVLKRYTAREPVPRATASSFMMRFATAAGTASPVPHPARAACHAPPLRSAAAGAAGDIGQEIGCEKRAGDSGPVIAGRAGRRRRLTGRKGEGVWAPVALWRAAATPACAICGDSRKSSSAAARAPSCGCGGGGVGKRGADGERRRCRKGAAGEGPGNAGVGAAESWADGSVLAGIRVGCPHAKTCGPGRRGRAAGLVEAAEDEGAVQLLGRLPQRLLHGPPRPRGREGREARVGVVGEGGEKGRERGGPRVAEGLLQELAQLAPRLPALGLKRTGKGGGGV